MKKARLLIAALVCAVMMMGVGYALFNDTTVVSATAKAGNFDVDFIDARGPVEVSPENVRVYLDRDNCDQDLLHCTISGIFPGQTVVIPIPVKNNCAVGAKLVNVECKRVNGDWGLYNQFQISGENNKKIAAGASDTCNLTVMLNSETDTKYQEQTVEFTVDLEWEQYLKTINTQS
ncbi:MAG: hypothetical protein ACOX2X_02265 [Peptococcia bacterium]|jgi:hypothetical protein